MTTAIEAIREVRKTQETRKKPLAIILAGHNSSSKSTLGRDEALEQKIVSAWVDRRDAEHVANRRIGRAAASLAENAEPARLPDDGIHGQEIGRIVETGDQPQLVP